MRFTRRQFDFQELGEKLGVRQLKRVLTFGISASSAGIC
jgi:hypothetical protein